MVFFILLTPKNLHLTSKKNNFVKNNLCNNNFFCNNFYTDIETKASPKIISEEIKNYQKFLPESFLSDESAPFLFSLLWFQKIGRTDLIKNLSQGENTLEIFGNSTFSFKGDPIFSIRKKIQKKKKRKNMLPLSLGKNIEDKLILFEYKTIKKNKTQAFQEKKIFFNNNDVILVNFDFGFLEMKLVNFSIIQRLLFPIFFLILALFSREFYFF